MNYKNNEISKLFEMIKVNLNYEVKEIDDMKVCVAPAGKACFR